MKVSPTEKERIRHINFLMEDFHGSLSDIYESLIDREYEPCSDAVKLLIYKLTELSESLNNEL